MAEEHTHPEEIARRLGVSGQAVRSLLRKKFPRTEETSGNRWHLDEDDMALIENHFRRTRRR